MLIDQMDLNGVDAATIVSAQIFKNFDNNDYVADAVRRYPHRLNQFADIDSFWSETYHTPGAAARLHKAIDRWPMKGFTHYVASQDDAEWFDSADGQAFFNLANDAKLIASIACGPQHQPMIRKVAERFPDLTILCHHMSGLRGYGDDAHDNLENVAESAKYPNIHLKWSGFHYMSEPGRNWNFPYAEVRWVYEEAYAAFGNRMVWGSDYPVVTGSMTHRQALESFRTHCTFVSEADQAAILGGTLKTLLDKARTVDL